MVSDEQHRLIAKREVMLIEQLYDKILKFLQEYKITGSSQQGEDFELSNVIFALKILLHVFEYHWIHGNMFREHDILQKKEFIKFLKEM